MMEIQQIRNATNKITYAGKTFLVDPWLVKKGGMGAMADIPGHAYQVPDPVKMQIAMPIFDLPLPVTDILAGVDGYIFTHLHADHIDLAADGTVGAPLDKGTPAFVQDEEDAAICRKSGFTDVRIVAAAGTAFGAITLTRVPSRHGTLVPCGNTMGVVLTAAQEKTLYISGDTIWYPDVQATLRRFQPAVVTVNACAAEESTCGRLIMNDEDVACVAASVPDATIFITHMDNVSHASITRYTMRGLLAKRQVTNYVMPEDGESVCF
ncbi:MBL fold metallo-hydrolase [uncultured Megasphaera sp.]|uniref:MBL fold metallo-hydrolase n=1 Tax=uncultured Megasphaera sp. TaxID=165188 RepID=UPI00258C31A3|nr:MBL fold metallo-hydrolase [uncultured Megasphaera sp.]